MNAFVNKVICFLAALILAVSCKEKSSLDLNKNLLHVYAYDTLAQISFPNYLALDTSYTWDDYSDCPCCGRLKIRFQNKKDSSYEEKGFIRLSSSPRYKTYVTYVFPETIKCFERKSDESSNFPEFEKRVSRNLLEQEFYRSHYTKNIFEFFYYNSKNQGVSVSMLCDFKKWKNELTAIIFVTTTNKRNQFPVTIKFEKTTKTSIREFVNCSLKIIHEIIVQ